MEKPNRFLLGQLASYAEEASAYLRRRRARSRPFARAWWRAGHGIAPDPESDGGRRLLDAADAIIGLVDDEGTRARSS